MGHRIFIIQGHPDPQGGHFCHALAEAYAEGAIAGGHEVQQIHVAALDFPWLKQKEDFEHGQPPAAIVDAQQAIAWADHLLIVYPLWLGTMPAVLKAFWEQTLRPGFAYEIGERGWKRRLSGKSARIVVSMGMPALIYRTYFRAHGLKALERSILRFCGIRPIRHHLVGSVESPDGAAREQWLAKMRAFGRSGG